MSEQLSPFTKVALEAILAELKYIAYLLPSDAGYKTANLINDRIQYYKGFVDG